MDTYTRLSIWTAWLLLSVASSTAVAENVFVFIVCHPGVSLAVADVRDVFVGEKQFSDAIKLVPVDNLAVQPVFLDKVMNMRAVKYANTWVKKSFRDGVHPPVVRANDTEVLDFIKRTRGSCGYVLSAPAGGVAVIMRF